ncbi:hypothetical protein JW868_00965 [Candidatus Woesearchaeota archaeon]|nr:hypothetical protein [Candidatus Woesearchaeota archaeon]
MEDTPIDLEQRIVLAKECCQSEVVVVDGQLYYVCAQCIEYKAKDDSLVPIDDAFISPYKQAFCDRQCYVDYCAD